MRGRRRPSVTDIHRGCKEAPVRRSLRWYLEVFFTGDSRPLVVNGAK